MVEARGDEGLGEDSGGGNGGWKRWRRGRKGRNRSDRQVLSVMCVQRNGKVENDV